MQVKTLNDYVDEVHKKFDKLDKEEIKKILSYGLKNYHYINYHGGDILLKEPKYSKLWMYTGKLYNKFETFYKYYISKLATKLRMLDKRRKTEWDGFYYFGLTDAAYPQFEEQKEDEIIMLDNIMLYRLYDELKSHNQYKHYFKVKHDDYCGYWKFNEHYEIENKNIVKL